MKSQNIKVNNCRKTTNTNSTTKQQLKLEVTNRKTQIRKRILIIATLLGLVLISIMAARPTFSLPTQQQQSQQQQGQQTPTESSPKGVFKRSFAGLGCLGVYDKGKFARLDRVCEECYQLYREPDIHQACRQDCFRNTVFTRCVDALLLSHEQKKFDEMVDELYGK